MLCRGGFLPPCFSSWRRLLAGFAILSNATHSLLRPVHSPLLTVNCELSPISSMTLRERLEWLTRMTFLLFILASAAFLSAITAMRIAIHGRRGPMPNLVGKNFSEASQLLQSRGLVLRVADRIYSDQPINVVVRQTPTSGLLLKVSQQGHVGPGLGQRQ